MQYLTQSGKTTVETADSAMSESQRWRGQSNISIMESSQTSTTTILSRSHSCFLCMMVTKTDDKSFSFFFPPTNSTTDLISVN